MRILLDEITLKPMIDEALGNTLQNLFIGLCG